MSPYVNYLFFTRQQKGNYSENDARTFLLYLIFDYKILVENKFDTSRASTSRVQQDEQSSWIDMHYNKLWNLQTMPKRLKYIVG